MAFYDRFFNRTRNLGNNLSNKARDSSEQRRLESEIRQLNKEIESIYTELGRKLFDSKVNGTENEYDTEVQRALDLQGMISAKNQRIEEIRSQIVCPNCGRMMPAGTTICTACGKFMIKDTAEEVPAIEMHDPEIKYCPICGAANEPDAVFCNDCGTPLRTGDPLVEEPAEQMAEEASDAPDADVTAPAEDEIFIDEPEPQAEEIVPPLSSKVDAIMDELPRDQDLDAVVDELIADVHAANEAVWNSEQP